LEFSEKRAREERRGEFVAPVRPTQRALEHDTLSRAV
jgi:hypothetical protein